ncbi:MAG: hypothetical protein REI12_05510 [Pedobacter sp.]|nr:hypothetical protein [Pedobacter sp.]
MRHITKGLTAIALGLSLSHAAFAEETSATAATAAADTANTDKTSAEQAAPVEKKETPRMENSTRLLHLAATGGLSVGGDTIATSYFTNGDKEKITAGGLFYFSAGLGIDLPLAPFTVQLTGGLHFDESTAENGKATFERNTLDAQIFYRQGNHRFGIGAVQHKAPEFIAKIDGQPDQRATFDDATGFSVEYNYLPAIINWPFKEGRAGFSLRYVSIDYTAKTVNGAPAQPKTFDGSHVAAGLYLYL